MSWRNIKLIFSREVRDQLRDRRTLFMVAVLPLLLYPALAIGMMQMRLLFNEQTRTVVVLGAGHLPDEPQLIEDGRFVAQWFDAPADALKLRVISDRHAAERGPDAGDGTQALLRQAKAIRSLLARRDELKTELAAATAAGTPAAVEPLARKLNAIVERLGETFRRSRMQVLILVPEGFARRLAQEGEPADLGRTPDLVVVRNQADEKSQVAYARVKNAIDAWGEEILERRLERAGLPEDFAAPVSAAPVDVARGNEISASVWSRIFPLLLVVMAVTGAFYPAIDLAAGEKERGTMETLLICPARRTEIVMGKFLTVMLFSMSTALLNLLSGVITGLYIASMAGGGALSRMGGLQPPAGAALVWVVVLLVPLAALFSALSLSLATFARSSKEGQYYLTPLLMVTMGLTVFSLMPGVEIAAFYSTMPVIGIALLLKTVLAAPGNIESFYFAVPVLITSIGYSLLALWWAIEQFSREDVLFREAERFEVRLWFKHLLRDKEPTPSFAEAGFCFVLIMLLQFAALRFFAEAVRSASPDEVPLRMVQLLMMQQLALIACPALFMGIILTTNVRSTFRLRWPSWTMWAAAAVLPLVLHPLTVELLAHLEWFFPPLPPQMAEALAAMSDPNMPLWLILLAFAVAPAVCEELAFRGFILSGFLRSHRTGLAIALSSLTFGIMHQIPQQVFNATLLGLVLGLIAVRSGSLLPGILFHLLYNALQVGRMQVEASAVTRTAAEWFVVVGEGGLRYRWPTLVIAGIIAAAVLAWLIGRPARRTPRLPQPAVSEPPREFGKPPVQVGR